MRYRLSTGETRIREWEHGLISCRFSFENSKIGMYKSCRFIEYPIRKCHVVVLIFE